MRFLQRADLARPAAVRLGAEQFLLHPLRRDRGGVHDDEGTGGPVRVVMDEARGQLLAGARGAGDHDTAVRRRDALDDLTQLVDRRGRADQRRGLAGLLAQFLHLAAELGGFQRPLGDEDEAVGLERLLDIVVGAALDGGDGGLDIAVAGDHDDRQVRVLLLDDVEQRQAVELGALQPDIEENQLRPALFDGGQALVAVGGRAHAVALVLENAGDQAPGCRFRRRR